MIRHNAAADPKIWGGHEIKLDGTWYSQVVKFRGVLGSDWRKTLNVISAFGLPPDARRVRLVVIHLKSSGYIEWCDGKTWANRHARHDGDPLPV